MVAWVQVAPSCALSVVVSTSKAERMIGWTSLFSCKALPMTAAMSSNLARRTACGSLFWPRKRFLKKSDRKKRTEGIWQPRAGRLHRQRRRSGHSRRQSWSRSRS